MRKQGFTTTILHSDRRRKPEHGTLHQPIHTSVAYGYDDVQDLVDVFQNKKTGFAYGRQNNPTIKALEEKITQMEEGLSSIVFSTGMAGVSSVMISLLRAGDHMISSSFLFGNTNSVFNTLTNLGIEVTFVDATDVENVKNAYQENTKLVFTETIANPATQVAHLDAIGDFCEEKDLVYVVDNTMTSPYLFKPKSVKASLVISSLTKYVGGHGNALAGSVTDTGIYDWTAYSNIYDNYKKLKPEMWGITQVRKKGVRDLGGALAPEAAHHIAIGAETLSLRMERASSNAVRLAEFFERQSKVSKVYYPGLPSHPQHALAKQLFRSFSSLMSIELEKGVDCFEFMNNLQVVISSSNLGDNRTLAIPVAHTIFFEMGPERRKSMGVSDSMIRLSVGIEDPEDLIEDFRFALLGS